MNCFFKAKVPSFCVANFGNSGAIPCNLRLKSESFISRKIQFRPHQSFQKRRNRQAGFTLLELMIIVTILGITALMVFPKLSAFGVNSGKTTIRHLSRLIQHLAQESLATKKYYRLYYDFEAGAYSVKILRGREFVPVSGGLIVGRKLPDNLSFEDVVTYRHGKVQDGEAFTEFFPLGVEKTTIHLRDGDVEWTLMVNGLTGRVKVFEGYIEKTERVGL